MARNYVPYRYRVLGITPFGELSTDAPIITAMGRDRTPPVPVHLTEVKDEKGKLVVHWEQPTQDADLKGYRVEKAPTAKSDHHALHTGLLPKNTFSFTDTSTYLIGENHYRVASVDTAGNVSYSNAGYGSLIDSVPPAPPIHISGTIDTTGLATLHWPLGKEQDIMGYRVFFANAPDHAFNNLTPYPIADTVFHDTVQIKTLTKRIYYRVVAVDRNYNHSEFSATPVSGPAYYSYRMVAVDSAGNVSQDGLVLEVRVYERMKRDAVRQVTAVRMDDHIVHVSWSAVPGKVEHYVIYRSKDAAEPMPLGSALAGKTAYDDIRLAGKGSYTYLVQAVYADGSASAIIPSAPPLEMR